MHERGELAYARSVLEQYRLLRNRRMERIGHEPVGALDLGFLPRELGPRNEAELRIACRYELIRSCVLRYPTYVLFIDSRAARKLL